MKAENNKIEEAKSFSYKFYSTLGTFIGASGGLFISGVALGIESLGVALGIMAVGHLRLFQTNFCSSIILSRKTKEGIAWIY